MRLIKILAAILTVIILSSTANAKGWQPEIRIGILNGVNEVNLQMSETCAIIDVSTQNTIGNINANDEITINVAALNVDAIEIRSENVQLKDLTATINGKKYFGGVRINKVTGALTVINLAPVEEYLRGVVPEEMPISFDTEALKAQAVAARSFTLKNRNRHFKDGYDLCATNHCQFYGGVESIKTITDNAITETRGEIVTFGGNVADTNFHTDSGGMTENVADVWGTNVPYLRAVAEFEMHTQVWTVEVAVKDFINKINANIGDFKRIKLTPLKIGKPTTDRSKSGRVKFALIVGTKGTVEITGNDMRSKFALPSTLFDINVAGDRIIFSGYGRGHGVGMSQCGANAYAKSGWTYDKILAHYYSGTALKKLY